MNKIKIHQFSPSAHEGDGITNGMFYLQSILKSLGFDTKIYAENFDVTLEKKVYHYTKYNNKDKNQLLFVHYSIYYDFAPWIDKVDAKKIMIYHNITPYKFFEEGSILYKLCKQGKEYLPELQNRVEGSIGDSQLNSSELIELDFNNVKTIPLLMDVDKIINAPWNEALYDNKVEDFNIIFVGRIARNKAQHDLIEIANIYSKMCSHFKMYIIGGTTDLSYEVELKELISEYQLEENVILTGKISNEDLYAHYKSAGTFLCMSEHEGFGIPLIEAMLFDVPVLAYNSSNIKSTLNGGGILFDEKKLEYIAATIGLLRENKAFKREILKTQREARKIYFHDKIVSELIAYLEPYDIKCEYTSVAKQDEVSFQFEGPFDSSYSLAMLNKYSALAFENKYPQKVSLFSTEGEGDYAPNKDFLRKNSKIKQMSEKSKKALQCDVAFRNLYPPRVTGMKGKINILNSFGWEESGFQKEFIDNFNANLDGISVMSKYVHNMLINNGVKIPVSVVGLGVEHVLQEQPKSIKLKTKKSFKFLHISSCFPRKGIDVLLKAYTQTFTKEDDVCLVIKTFPNPHNDVENQIKLMNKNDINAPEIVLINKDIEASSISWLYQNCNCLVAPSRGEGFGLPMAESMLFNLPVITTGYGGQTDFCTEETSWLIDYSFEKADTHLNLFNSYWAEPSCEHLKTLLQEQVNLSDALKLDKTKKAHALITKEFTWDKYREKTEFLIDEIKNEKIFDEEQKNIAWVSSFNTKCGIATYSEFIINNFDREQYKITKFANYSDEILDESKEIDVIRCWNNRFDNDLSLLSSEIISKNFSHVVINFNFGFFSMENLKELIGSLKKENIKITIIFHSVADVTIEGLESSLSWIKEALHEVDNLLVHNIEDLNFFKNLKLENMNLFPHGVQNRVKEKVLLDGEVKVLASYGFLLPHKGILELIEAFSLITENFPALELLLVTSLYPAKESKEYHQLCVEKIEALNLNQKVKIVTDFLSDEESLKLLDTADLIILPYRKTHESSSASVRYAVSTKKPVLCTKQAIFNDVEDIVHFTKGFSSHEMAESISTLIGDKNLLYSKIDLQEAWIDEHDWKHVASKLENFLNY